MTVARFTFNTYDVQTKTDAMPCTDQGLNAVARGPVAWAASDAVVQLRLD